jgi:hypothetical protein
MTELNGHTDGEVVIMLAFQASGTGSIPVRCNNFFLDPHCHVVSDLEFICSSAILYRSYLASSITMKQLLFKRRRVSSNPHVPLPSSDAIVTSPKPSRISTCSSCHRAVRLKSNPAFLCARFIVFPSLVLIIISPHILGQHRRCNASTCAICLRTCTGYPVSSPRWASSLNLGCDSTAIPLSESNTNNSSPPCRRRPRDEDSDNVSKSTDVDSERSGCGQMMCRACCFEHPQRSESIEPHRTPQLIQDLFSGAIACLDCSEKRLAPQTHESNASMPGARNSDHSLTASS